MVTFRSTNKVACAVWALAASAALLVSGCSSSGGRSSSPTGSAAATAPPAAAKNDATAAELVPAAIKAKGVLRVASDATYPPLESVGSDGTTIVGADADLAAAIGQVLGLKVQMVNASFDTIIPGLQAGKYDMGMSGFNDTKARQATVDFVDYYKGGSSFFVKASGGPNVAGLSDLCGLKVAVEKGTTQQDDVTAQDKSCKSAGKPGIDLLVYPDQNATNLALSSGRAEVSIADSPVAAYQVAHSGGQFKLSGSEYGVVLHGIALPKGNGMANAVRAAVTALIKQGVYAKVMAKWGIGDADRINEVTVDGATS